MRADNTDLRTWWLGGLALWALAMWIAALAGLGTRVQMLPAGCRQVGCPEGVEVRKDLPVGARSRVGVVR